MDLTTRRSASRRSNILGGCRTCRRRHVKCDKALPSCHQCTSKELICDGYPSGISWMPFSSYGIPGRKSRKNPRLSVDTRHFMYSESSRKHMNNLINSGLLRGSVDISLEQIDICSEKLGSKGEHTVGPFNVFDASVKNDEEDNKSDHHRSNVDYYFPIDVSATILPAISSPEVPFPTDGLLQWSDLFGLDEDLSRFVPEFSIDNEAGFDLTQTSCNYNPREAVAGSGTEFDAHLMSYNDVSNEETSSDILKDAGFLIRHFEQAVIPLLTIFSPKKSPWSILNIPAALETLGQLKIMESENISHARLANLFGLLACASCHLVASQGVGTLHCESNSHWKAVHENAYVIAKDHMRISLEAESGGPRKAKLKDQMMASYGLTECAIFSDRPQDARLYLTDTEYLLTSRGLSKRSISRKNRLLFNVYVWLRILGESTYVLRNQIPTDSMAESINVPHKTQVPPRQETLASIYDRGLRLDEFLRFESADHELNIDDPKDRGLDLFDIHLHDSRKSSESLSYHVYGMSETWLSLVSQITRLSNIMSAVTATQSPDVQISSQAMRAIQKREIRLENVIQSHVRRMDLQFIQKQESHKIRMGRALNHALVIFFYRRVRNIHPDMLESQVDKVTAELRAYFTDSNHSTNPGPSTLWPLFIAGCEALSRVQREKIMELLDLMALKTDIIPFKETKRIMLELWIKQDEQISRDDSQPLPTWVDILRSQQNWLVLA